MSAQILDGKLLAQQLKNSLSAEVSVLKAKTGKSIRVVSIIVGNDPSSQSYTLSQQRTAESIGIQYELQSLKADIPAQEFLDFIINLNNFSDVHGIIINKPLPAHLDFKTAVNAIDPHKDIEGMNLCTPAAAIALLKSSGVDLAGKEAIVVGRSDIVGKPVALLLLNENVTVTICHSATSQAGKLEEHLKRADIVIAAIGKPRFVKGDWIKKGAIVIDVGINQVGDKIVGDVDYDSCVGVAGFITPVPGGVGPVTSVILMKNALEAYRKQLCLPR